MNEDSSQSFLLLDELHRYSEATTTRPAVDEDGRFIAFLDDYNTVVYLSEYGYVEKASRDDVEFVMPKE